jgi:hypothetical protein
VGRFIVANGGFADVYQGSLTGVRDEGCTQVAVKKVRNALFNADGAAVSSRPMLPRVKNVNLCLGLSSRA